MNDDTVTQELNTLQQLIDDVASAERKYATEDWLLLTLYAKDALAGNELLGVLSSGQVANLKVIINIAEGKLTYERNHKRKLAA